MKDGNKISFTSNNSSGFNNNTNKIEELENELNILKNENMELKKKIVNVNKESTLHFENNPNNNIIKTSTKFNNNNKLKIQGKVIDTKDAKKSKTDSSSSGNNKFATSSKYSTLKEKKNSDEVYIFNKDLNNFIIPQISDVNANRKTNSFGTSTILDEKNSYGINDFIKESLIGKKFESNNALYGNNKNFNTMKESKGCIILENLDSKSNDFNKPFARSTNYNEILNNNLCSYDVVGNKLIKALVNSDNVELKSKVKSSIYKLQKSKKFENENNKKLFLSHIDEMPLYLHNAVVSEKNSKKTFFNHASSESQSIKSQYTFGSSGNFNSYNFNNNISNNSNNLNTNNQLGNGQHLSVNYNVNKTNLSNSNLEKKFKNEKYMKNKLQLIDQKSTVNKDMRNISNEKYSDKMNENFQNNIKENDTNEKSDLQHIVANNKTFSNRIELTKSELKIDKNTVLKNIGYFIKQNESKHNERNTISKSPEPKNDDKNISTRNINNMLQIFESESNPNTNELLNNNGTISETYEDSSKLYMRTSIVTAEKASINQGNKSNGNFDDSYMILTNSSVNNKILTDNSLNLSGISNNKEVFQTLNSNRSINLKSNNNTSPGFFPKNNPNQIQNNTGRTVLTNNKKSLNTETSIYKNKVESIINFISEGNTTHDYSTNSQNKSQETVINCRNNSSFNNIKNNKSNDTESSKEIILKEVKEIKDKGQENIVKKTSNINNITTKIKQIKCSPYLIIKSHLDCVRALTSISTSNGNFLVSAGDDLTLKLWDLKLLEDISNGKLLKNNQTIKDFSFKEPALTLRGHSNSIYTLESTGDLILSSGTDGIIRQWSVEKEVLNNPFSSDDQLSICLKNVIEASKEMIWSMKYFNGKLAVASADGVVSIWKISNTLKKNKGKYLLASLKSKNYKNNLFDIPTCVCWYEENKIFSSYVGTIVKLFDLDKKVSIMDVNTTLETDQINNNSQVNKVILNNDKNMMILGTEDRMLKFFDIRENSLIKSFIGHTDSISNVQMGLNEFELITSSHDGKIRSWDIRNYNLLSEVGSHLNKFDEGVLDTILLQNCECLVSCGADSLVKVYKYS